MARVTLRNLQPKKLSQVRWISRSGKSENILESVVSAEEWSVARPYSEVPGPTPLPFIGNTWRLLPVIGQYQVSDLGKVSRLLYEQYGKVVKMAGLVGRPDLLFLYDCNEIEKVYRQEGPTPFRPSMPCLVKYKSQVRKEFFGELAGVVGVAKTGFGNLIHKSACDCINEQPRIRDTQKVWNENNQDIFNSSEICVREYSTKYMHGEPWREFRTKVQKPVLQIQTVRKYIEPIEEVTNDFINKIENLRDENSEMPKDFDNEIHKWALECIGRVALDVRLGCLDPNLSPDSEAQNIIECARYALRNIAILELKAPFWRYLPSSLWTRYVKNMDYFIKICMKHIDAAMERLKSKKSLDEKDLSLIERVLASENNPKTAYILALDLILVGIDTISMAVCSILYQLATRQEEQQKMYEEMRKVFPDPKAILTAKDLDQLLYTKAFIKEVFRMYSTVIGNGRTLQQDMVIGGFQIPKGVQIVFPTLVTGNMEEYVTKAGKFFPERWLKNNLSEMEYKIHPFASLPYGHGARMCLGRRFADLEMQILLAKLIRRFKLEFLHKPLTYKVTFMYAPDGDLQFKVTERDS